MLNSLAISGINDYGCGKFRRRRRVSSGSNSLCKSSQRGAATPRLSVIQEAQDDEVSQSVGSSSQVFVANYKSPYERCLERCREQQAQPALPPLSTAAAAATAPPPPNAGIDHDSMACNWGRVWCECYLGNSVYRSTVSGSLGPECQTCTALAAGLQGAVLAAVSPTETELLAKSLPVAPRLEHTDKQSALLVVEGRQQYTFDCYTWPEAAQCRQPTAWPAPGAAGYPRVWRGACYSGCWPLTRANEYLEFSFGRGGEEDPCKGKRERPRAGPKFKSAGASHWNATCGGARNGRRGKGAKVVNCHRHSTTTITTKTQHRRACAGCTQRFKHHCPLVPGKGGERAATVRARARATTTTTTTATATAITTTITTTTDPNKLWHDSRRPQRHGQGHPHRRRRQHCSPRRGEHVRCDNNNLSHLQPQERRLRAPTTATTATTVNTEPASAHPDLREIARASASALSSTGRQLTRGGSNCYSSSSRASSRLLSARTDLPASVVSTPPSSSAPSLRLFSKTTTFTPPPRRPPPPPPPPPQQQRLQQQLQQRQQRPTRTTSRHEPLLASSSIPGPPLERRDPVAPVVVALPFALAPSQTRAPSSGSGVGCDSVGLTDDSGSRDAGSTVFATRQPYRRPCFRGSTSGQDPRVQETAHPTRPVAYRKPADTTLAVQPEATNITTTTAAAATTTTTTNTTHSSDRGEKKKTTMTSRTSAADDYRDPRQMMITQPHLRASNNHRGRAQIKPPVARQNKPLLETPPMPALVQQPPSHRASRMNPDKQNANSSLTGSPASSSSSSSSSNVQRNGAPPSRDSLVLNPSRDKGPVTGGKTLSPPADEGPQEPSISFARQLKGRPVDEPLGASNVHSLESIGQRARMAISIYDPLPAQQKPDCPSGRQATRERAPSPCGDSTIINRPTILNLNEANGHNVLAGPRRRHPRRRESLYGDRFLKSPTIPEEPSELSGLVDEDNATAQRRTSTPPMSPGDSVHSGSRVTGGGGGGGAGPADKFLVATIEPEWGGISKRLIVHSDCTLESLTQDVFKRLIEIEHEHQNSARASVRSSNGRASRGRATGRKNEARPSANNNMDVFHRLECEAEKLAKMFKEHLENEHQQQAQESSDSSFHDKSCSMGHQKSDPTAMSRDEQARFFNPNHRVNERHKPKCENKEANNGNGDNNQDVDNTKSAFDFKCSCCCLHLINQPRRADGETWCCCGCS